MTDKHDSFNAQRLFERKSKFCGYAFCPLCGRDLVQKQMDGRQRMVCQSEDCDFVFYQNPIPAAGAIVVNNNRVLLVKRAHPPKVGWWCLPAGFMEWDEHPTQTAVRELEEETGLKVRLTSFFEVYSGHDDPRSNAILILYLADVVGGTARPADDALEIRYFGFDELPDRIAFEAHRQALADYIARHCRGN